MAPTPLHGLPAPPLTVSCARPTTEKKKEKQKRVARCARSVSTKVDTHQQPRAPTTAIASRFTPCVDDSFDVRQMCRPTVGTHRQRTGSVRGGAVWVGRTVGAMDGAIEPPWVRALCLRSTASQAPERPAASGWAGPRSGVYGVSCPPTPPRHPTQCRSCFGRCRCFGLQRVQGRKPCRKTPYPAITASISSALRARPSVSTR